MYTHQGRFLKAPLKIIGGKQKTRDVIYALKPADTSIFVEPFLGSGAVMIGLEGTSADFVNDFNSDIIHFYRQLQSNPSALFEHIQYRLARLRKEGKEYFLKLRDEDRASMTDVARAAWLYIINKSCFNGIIRYSAEGKCNSSYCGTSEGRGWITEEWLHKLSERIKRAAFSNTDFRDFMVPFQHSDASWLFLDPPYFLRGQEDSKGTVTIYNGKKFTTQDHEDLASLLKETSTRWLMTINDCEWTREKYRDFIITDNQINYSCSQTNAGRGFKNELLIRNYG